MNGKVNIVFGFIYLATTAILGPVLLVPGKGENFKILMETRKVVEEVKSGSVSADKGISAIMDYLDDSRKIGFIASTAHAHGNLEALLNIAAGVVLLMLVIPQNYKTLLSILFIGGAVLHSGALYLVSVFGMSFLGRFSLIGAILLVAGLLLTGIASIVGIKGDIKREN